MAPHGRIVVIGSRGRIEIDPRGTMGKDLSVHGMALPNANAKEIASIHAALGAGLANRTLRPVVGAEFELSEAARGHAAVGDSAVLGKVVLIP